MRNLPYFLTLGMLVACGIPGDTPLLELTADDADTICKHAVDEDAEDRVITCDSGDVTIPASTMQDCLDYFAAVLEVNRADCTATLDQWVSCKEEDEPTDDQICNGTVPAASADCTAIGLCVTPETTGSMPSM